jgi:4,5-DOPA dioxygenase extradiol
MAHPPTIHDFGAGLRRLFEIQYPTPGDPELAGHISTALKPLEVTLDHSWGLDHEAWAVLRKAYPDPDVPVLQLSVDMTRGPHSEVAVIECDGVHQADISMLAFPLDSQS